MAAWILSLTIGMALVSVSMARGASSDYGLESVGAKTTSSVAGAHPDVTLEFALKTDPSSPEIKGLHQTYGTTRDLGFELPPGLLGNLNAVDECPTAQFLQSNGQGNGEVYPPCPFSSQVGVARGSVYNLRPFTDAIYLIEPPTSGDVVARLGLFAGVVPVILNVRVRSGSDYGLTVTAEGANGTKRLVKSKATIWGVPGASSHDHERLVPTEFEKVASPPREFGREAEPFLTNPTSCGEPLRVGFSADSYELPSQVSRMETTLPAITGCESLRFEPSFSAVPTSPVAETPTGLDATLVIPQDESLEGHATAQMNGASVALPAGMTIAPGAGDGLQACSAEQVGYESTHPAECPLASQIGTVSFQVPALRDEAPGVPRVLHGRVFQRTPVPGDQFRIWLSADEDGVHVAIPGDIHADPLTGQLTNVFLDTPQVPLKELQLHIKSGARAPLATPRECGTYQSHYEFTPWSGDATVVGDTPMMIDQGCGTGGFAPQLSAGSTSNDAGAFTSFALDVTRGSGQQNITQINATLPPGLLAKLRGVALCGAREAVTGACPAGSQVGTVAVAAGPGPDPLWVPQPGKAPTAVYLAGPYEGAPYSLVVKVPAQAGPFDLGTVVVRAGLFVDPTSTQVTVKSDPLPQILEGVPVTYRDVHVEVNRPEFMLNPTDCEPLVVGARLAGSAGAVADRSGRFQVSGCAGLAFKPRFAASTRGKTSKADGASLDVKVSFPSTVQGTQANIHSVKVDLPKQLPSRLTTLQKACTAAVFDANPAGCPKESVVGMAVAHTPILNNPLTGPAYFVSHGGEAFPQLVVVLQGENGLVVDLAGDTFISKTGITSSTFASVPDVPVSSFELMLPQGKYSALTANGNLCDTKLVMPTEFKAQNGTELKQSTPIEVEGCSTALSIASHTIKKKSATLRVYVPAAGKVSVSGQGISSSSKTSKDREVLTLEVHQKHTGRLHTRLRVTYTPSTGKTRKRQTKTLKVTFTK
jgi:hypothetical protein